VKSQHYVLFPPEVGQLEAVFLVAGARRDIEIRCAGTGLQGCHELSSRERISAQPQTKEF
jgi:hypothetical protein